MRNIKYARTSDIGLALRDALEHITHIPVYGNDERDSIEIWDVDASSNPNNVRIDLVNGQTFIARILAPGEHDA